MKNYIPFLKAKINEFGGLLNLEESILRSLTPFFDIPRKNEAPYKEEVYVKLIERIEKNIKKISSNVPYFYIDDYDIDDALYVRGVQSYYFVMEFLKDYCFVPVIGIDRSDERNNIVFTNKSLVSMDTVAIRISVEDLKSGLLDLKYLKEEALKNFNNIELIIDMRVIGKNDNSQEKIEIIKNFLSKGDHFSKIVLTGSSIPAYIRNVVAPNNAIDLERREVEIQRSINMYYSDLFYGDYTTISPNFTDISIDPKMIQNVMTAKVIYSYDDRHYIIRGNSIKKSGFEQYYDFCRRICKKSFFRGPNYSFGDSFFSNASNMDKKITPSTIIKPTVNAHITYMIKDFSF